MRIDTRVAIGSPTARLALILVLTLAMAIAASAVVVGAASLLPRSAIVVAQDGSGTVTTIADAVAMAIDGDTILVRPGVYPESVVIGADVTIRGDGPREEVVIESPREGDLFGEVRYALALDDTTATVSGLTLRGEHSRVRIHGGTPTLDGLVFESVDFALGRGNSTGALIIGGGSKALVRGGRFIDGGGISTFSSSPRIEGNELINGPHVWIDQEDDGLSAGDPVFVDNVVQGALVRAVGIYEASNARFERNRFLDLPTAFELGGNVSRGVDPVIVGNTFKVTSSAITMGPDAAPRIDGNDISGAATGIVAASSGATVRDNLIHDNTTGIAVTSRDVPVIEDNTIEDNATGVRSGTVDSVLGFSGNAFCRNETDLATPEGSALTLDGNQVCEASPAP